MQRTRKTAPLAHSGFVMVFKETSVFTQQIRKLIPDEAYREFQQELIFNPIAGDLIKGSGGLRQEASAAELG